MASALAFPSVQIKKKVQENESLATSLPGFSGLVPTEISSACRYLHCVYCLLLHDEKTKQRASIKNEGKIIQGNLKQNHYSMYY